MKIKGKNKKAVLTAVYVPEDLFNKLTEMAEAKRISRNRMIVNILQETAGKEKMFAQNITEASGEPKMNEYKEKIVDVVSILLDENKEATDYGEISVEKLGSFQRECYEYRNKAVELIGTSIPIGWINDFTKNSSFAKNNPAFSKYIDVLIEAWIEEWADRSKYFRKKIEDTEEENETN